MLLLESISHDDLKKFIKEFYSYAIKHLKFDKHPKIIFKRDKHNSQDFFGKTGYYDPENQAIALFISDRHAKDVLRSFAHELIHHEQNCRNDYEKLDLQKTATDPAYATNDPDLREMEREAFERGNLLFRDWCDMKKTERTQIMNEKKDLVESILEKVLERLKLESKGTDIPKKDEPRFKKKKKEIHKAIMKKGDKKPKDAWAVASEKAAEFVGAKPKGTDKKEVKEAAKPDFLDLDGDGNKKEPMKKAAKDAKKKKPVDEAGVGFGEGPEGKEKLQESKQPEIIHPYPQLFQQKERLMKERFNTHEEIVFQELLKRAIKEQK